MSAAARISPVTSQPGDLTAAWNGADGRPVQVVVKVPRPLHGLTVELSPSAAGNSAAILSALARLREAGGGELRLKPGLYRIASEDTERNPLLSLDGLTDVTITGKGATLMLMRWGTGIRIRNSQRVRLADFELRYANPALVTGSIVQTAGGLGLAIGPAQLSADAQPVVHQITTLNPRGPGYAIHGTRLIFGKAGVTFRPAGKGVFTTVGKLVGFQPGDRVAIKLTYYDGAALSVNDSAGLASQDIVVDHVTIANSSGMAITVGRMGRGLGVINSRLGPATAADGVASIPFDGIHVAAMAGDILIQNNHISGTGDDGINLSSPVLDVLGTGEAGVVNIKNAGAFAPQETLALFDADLKYLGSSTVNGRAPTGPDRTSAVQLASTIPNVQLARYARAASTVGSRYAIIGNTIADCECHGLLAQGPNGLISKNQFSGLRYNAIRLLTSGVWNEGSGATNVVVVDNVIHDTGADTKLGFLWGAISAYGEIGTLGGPSHMTSVPVNSGLLITGNTITNTQDVCVSISDTEDATLTHNHCDQTMLGGASKTGSFGNSANDDKRRRLGIWIDPKTTANIVFDQ